MLPLQKPFEYVATALLRKRKERISSEAKNLTKVYTLKKVESTGGNFRRVDGYEYICIVYTTCNTRDDDTGAFILKSEKLQISTALMYTCRICLWSRSQIRWI